MINSDQNFVTIEEFMSIAIQFEADSAAFYKAFQGQVTDKIARELLVLLEKEELGHQNALMEFEIGDDATGILQFSPSFSLSMPVMPLKSPGIREIFDVALAREQKAVEIYEKAASIVSGGLKELLLGLSNFEKQHVEKVLSLKTLLL